MAVNSVLIAEGITGNSSILANAIQIFSCTFGALNPGAMGTGANDSRSGKPNFTNLTISKALDATSPYFLEKMTKCAAIPTVTVKYFKNINNQNELYIEYKLTNAYVASIFHGGADENPQENVSFNFDQIDFSYYKEKATNDGVELEATKCYNVRTNVSS